MSIPAPLDSSRRVLVAEYDATQPRPLSHILQGAGYEVMCAPNGRMALDMARRERPRLLVSEVGLPEMNGYELCARIKSDLELADLPVILVTTLSDPQEVIRTLDCRADHIVFKPCGSGQLLRCIQSVLANRPVRQAEPPGKDLEIMFGGQKHFIAADRPRILNLLLSTYEAAVECNREREQGYQALRQAQNSLIQQERLRARGETAGGVSPAAHQTGSAGPSQTASTGRHVAPMFASRSLRVLLIDDDSALLESLRSALQDEGHKVTTSGGGQAGIDAFREAQRNGKLFDIVITDLGMPYVDGRQVVASVREMSPGTPIILLTGWGQHVVNDQDQPPQVDRLLGKPPRIRELRAALAELTGRRATDRPC